MDERTLKLYWQLEAACGDYTQEEIVVALAARLHSLSSGRSFGQMAAGEALLFMNNGWDLAQSNVRRGRTQTELLLFTAGMLKGIVDACQTPLLVTADEGSSGGSSGSDPVAT
jgi:hypothetical protein